MINITETEFSEGKFKEINALLFAHSDEYDSGEGLCAGITLDILNMRNQISSDCIHVQRARLKQIRSRIKALTALADEAEIILNNVK